MNCFGECVINPSKNVDIFSSKASMKKKLPKAEIDENIFIFVLYITLFLSNLLFLNNPEILRYFYVKFYHFFQKKFQLKNIKLKFI